MQISYSVNDALSVTNCNLRELLSRCLNANDNFVYIVLSSKDHEKLNKPCVYRLHKNVIIELIHISGNFEGYELEVEVLPMIHQNKDCFFLLSLQDVVNLMPSGPSKKIKGAVVDEYIPGDKEKLALQRAVDANIDECRIVKADNCKPMVKSCQNNVAMRVKVSLDNIFITADSNVIKDRVLDNTIPWAYHPANLECPLRPKLLYRMMYLYENEGNEKTLSDVVRTVLNEVGINDPSEDMIKSFTPYINKKCTLLKNAKIA